MDIGRYVAFVAMALLVASVASMPGHAATIVVTSTADTVDGNVSSPEALQANPGGDGITLREALLAANNAPGPHTVTFAGSMAGRTIVLTRSQLTIERDGTTLVGLAGADGRPSVTIDVNAARQAVIAILGSGVTVRLLRFTRVQDSMPLWIAAGMTGGFATPLETRDVRIEDNEIQGTGTGGTFLTVPITVGSALGSVNARVRNITIARNRLSSFRERNEGVAGVHLAMDGANGLMENVVVRDNTFDDIDFGIEVVNANGTGNRIAATQISGNRFTRCSQGIAMENIAATGGSNNAIEGTLVANNVFDANGVAMSVYGGIYTPGTGNRVVDTQFVGNTVTNQEGGLTIAGGTTNATGNLVDGVTISGNTFRNLRGVSLFVMGGNDGASGNTVLDVRFVNNLVARATAFGAVEVTGGLARARQNTVSNVRIVNDTFADNRGYAMKVDQNSGDATGNSVADVVVSNSVFWNNEFDFGSEPTASQVFSSITAAPGFANVNGNSPANPRFVDSAGGDYHMQLGSVGTGLARRADATFEDSECRSRGLFPDIGAYQNGGASSCDAATSNVTWLWWNPRESGWGINLNHQGDIVFATLFTYAADGRPLWLVASNLQRQADGSFTGILYRTTGPAFDRVPFTGATVTTATSVGTMTLRFPHASVGSVSYSMGGRSVTKLIQKQVFDVPAPKCTAAQGSRAQESNYQDLWWNPQEPGWGINLTHQGSTMFATLFTYDASGRDLWLVASNLPRQADGSFTGALFSAQGPAFDAVPWSAVTTASVGAMTLRFAGGDSGTLTYTYNGVTVNKAITRQVFASATPVCR